MHRRSPVALRRAALIAAGFATAMATWTIAAVPSYADAPRVWVSRAGGVAIAENAQVSTGEHVHLRVTNFAPYAVVLLQFGSTALTTPIETDDGGTGQVWFTIPAVSSDVYVVTASSDSSSATFVVSLANPALPASGPKPLPPSAPAPRVAAARTATITTLSARTPTLATTGGVAPVYPTAAAAALVIGIVLVNVGAPEALGRHERPRSAGRHRAGVGPSPRGA